MPGDEEDVLTFLGYKGYLEVKVELLVIVLFFSQEIYDWFSLYEFGRPAVV